MAKRSSGCRAFVLSLLAFYFFRLFCPPPLQLPLALLAAALHGRLLQALATIASRESKESRDPARRRLRLRFDYGRGVS